MACGLPVLLTRVGGLPEMVTPDTGLMVEPKSPQALAQGLKTLWADQDRLAQMGRAAREHVAKNFTWAACADRLLKGLGLKKTEPA
jgi:glycosyltransferase involved in cell wall biosynthesis